MKGAFMQRHIIHYNLVVLLVGIAALSTVQTQAQTQQTRQISIIQDMAPVGLAYAQTLRISEFNPNDPQAPGADGRKYKMLLAFLILDGSVVAQSTEIVLPAGEFRFFDLDRAALNLAGENSTGRIQLRVRVRLLITLPSADRTHPDTDFPFSLELVDDATGKTTVMVSKKPKEIVYVGS
jgi:hypothetical protein